MKRVPLIAVVALLAAGTPVLAADWYVGPEGKADNAGTKAAPWDIASALDGKGKVEPGDNLLLLAGTYKRRPREHFDVRLVGAEVKPIRVRPAPGARVTIDGGLATQAPSAHVWIEGLEVLVSEPRPDEPVSPGSAPKDLTRPHGGLYMFGGKNCKYINCAVHDTNQAISCWSGEIDCLIYGCILYDNGWQGTDRGHGHCIYTQNEKGTKTISNCIMAAKYDGAYTVHAYGSSKAFVDNFVLTDNICFGRGPFLVGGGKPSRNIQVLHNYLYGVGMQIGYNAPDNEDCVIRDNLIVNGGLTINKYKKVENVGNVILAKGDKRPAGPAEVVLLVNKYDWTRAHLAIFNWGQAAKVEVNVEGFLKPGERFRAMDAKDFFGKPVQTGQCRGRTISLSSLSGEFAVFVLVKETGVGNPGDAGPSPRPAPAKGEGEGR